MTIQKASISVQLIHDHVDAASEGENVRERMGWRECEGENVRERM